MTSPYRQGRDRNRRQQRYRGCQRRLAAAGARVVVGYSRGLDRAEKLIGELPATGHCAMHLPLEDAAQIRRVAAVVADQFGRADILVNSAGFTRMVPHADLESPDDDLIDAVLTANVRGPSAPWPLLRISGNALIVNISSGAATEWRQQQLSPAPQKRRSIQ